MFIFKYLPHKKPDEKIIFYLHRHWFILLKLIIGYLVLAFIPLAVYIFVQRELSYWLNHDIITIFLKLLVFSFYLFWWLMFYHSFLDYFLDIWIVTNHRVLSIEQRSLFNRAVAEYRLYRIQDVMSHQKGMLPTFFNYGEIHIQTAGAEKVVVFEQVPDPHYVAREITKLIEEYKGLVNSSLDGPDK